MNEISVSLVVFFLFGTAYGFGNSSVNVGSGIVTGKGRFFFAARLDCWGTRSHHLFSMPTVLT
jgi:hypothetical protein